MRPKAVATRYSLMAMPESLSWTVNQNIRALASYWPTARALTPTSAAAVGLFLALLSIPLRKRLFGRRSKRLRITPMRGKRVDFFVRDGVDISVLREMFVERDYVVESESPTHIADLGAHIGAAALFFHARYPETRITSYEPDPENFSLLTKNRSGFSTIDCVNAAVAGTSGTVTLYAHKGGSTRATLSRDPDTVGERMVPAVLFEDVIGNGADFVKFDVEGAEYDLFAAAPQAARQKVKYYVGEFHAALTGKTQAQFEALFPGFSFTWRNEALVSMHKN